MLSIQEGDEGVDDEVVRIDRCWRSREIEWEGKVGTSQG